MLDLCAGFVYWICVLDLCAGFVCWICVLDLCAGFVCWICVMDVCAGFVSHKVRSSGGLCVYENEHLTFRERRDFFFL